MHYFYHCNLTYLIQESSSSCDIMISNDWLYIAMTIVFYYIEPTEHLVLKLNTTVCITITEYAAQKNSVCTKFHNSTAQKLIKNWHCAIINPKNQERKCYKYFYHCFLFTEDTQCDLIKYYCTSNNKIEMKFGLKESAFLSQMPSNVAQISYSLNFLHRRWK